MKVTERELLEVIADEAIIDLISLLFQLEESYGVVIEEGDMPEMATLGEMVDFLLGRINQAAA
jgi:hypothetical protein